MKTTLGADAKKLKRLNAAFNEVKSMTDPESKLYYRSEEYKALRKHRRQMKKQQNPVRNKEKKSRKDWNATYYKKKKDEQKAAEEIAHQQHQAMEPDVAVANHLEELQMLKDEKKALIE